MQAVEAAQIKVTGMPFQNRMAMKHAIGRAKKGLPEILHVTGKVEDSALSKESNNYTL